MEKFKNDRLTFKELLVEIASIVKKFFSRCGIDDEMLKIPDKLKKSGTKVEVMNLAMTIIGIFFSFLLTITNMAIEKKMILLGIILFMLYRGQQVAKEATRLMASAEREKNNLIVKDEVSFRASKLIAQSSNKVMKYNNGIFTVMSNEEVLNCVKKYLSKLWEAKICHKFQLFEMLSVLIMLIAAVATNENIPNQLFIPLLGIFVVISFFSSAYVSISGKRFYTKNKEYDNKQSIILNDVLRVPEIAIGRDVKMRISILQKTLEDSNNNNIDYTKKRNRNNLIVAVLETISQYGIIIFYLFGIEWSSINLGTIAEITANLVIVETALGHISSIFHSISYYAELVNGVEKEEEDIRKILDVYYSEINRLSSSKKITDINIPDFSISYIEESENDKPFTLIAKAPITIKEGEIAILYGPSGSGKSTFMNMLTQRISLKQTTEIPSTSRFMFYDEKLRFGSLSIHEEIFCCDEHPDYGKMQAILENLHLWSEISQNCHNVWKWMQEKKFGKSLSNGQKQRLILAKMLYWLDDNIDVLVLDEATSGLDTNSEADSADAVRILEYIVKFANRDRKRTVIIATHQGINSFINKLEAEAYTFRILQFNKSGDVNEVTQVK